jgi:hypothetical protein
MAQKLISNSKRDKLLTKCEGLMLRGIDSPTEVSELLNISFNTAKAYIGLIWERWSSSSDVDKLQFKRQELIRKTEEIIKESWELKKSARNTLEAVGALRTALMAIERLEKLQGLDSLPLPIEKSDETLTFEFAQEIIALPEEEKQMAFNMIEKEIKSRGDT